MLTDQEFVFSTSPYPGLRSFMPHEADIFFGREEQVDELLKRVQSTRFLAIVGTSGCGKSSLVKAGMIPALDAGFLAEAGTRWCVAEMRPGEAPFDRLNTALLAALSWAEPGISAFQTESFVRAALRRGPLGLVEVLRERGMPDGANLLVVVDQFEEIFRFHREGNADEADAFVNLLLTSCAQTEFPVYVVLTMRSDFLGECALFDGLPQALNSNQFLAPRLSRKECEAVIVKPARVFGGDVDPLLVNHLLNDMGTDSDQLPLLQHALMRMWDRAAASTEKSASGYKEGPVLKLADYKAIGGLKDALSRHADEVYGEFDSERQKIVESLFRRLTERGVGKRDIRRPTRLDELAMVARADLDDVKAIVEVFRRSDRSFLMPPPPIPLNQDTIIDIGHESLIRQWHRLNGWVTTEAESARLYRRLAEDALLHEQGRASYLTDPQLQIALDWYDRNQPNQGWANRYSEADFSQVKSYLEASQVERERLQNKQKKATKRLRALVVALGVLTLVMIGITAYAIIQNRKLNDAYQQIQGQQMSLRSQSDTLKYINVDLKKQRDSAEVERRKSDSLREVAIEQKNLIALSEKRIKVALNKQKELTALAEASALALRQNNLQDSLHLSGLIALEKGQLNSAKTCFVLMNSRNDSNVENNWWRSYNLGLINHKRREYKEAVNNYRAAMSKLEATDNTIIERAITQYRLAQVFQDRTDTSASMSAIDCYKLALLLFDDIEKLKDNKNSTFSKDDYTTSINYKADIEVNLADLYRSLDKKEETKAHYNSALVKLEKLYGYQSTRALEVVDKLAHVYLGEQTKEAYNEAEKLLKHEIEGISGKYGPTHYSLAYVYRDLASIYDSTHSHKDTALTLHKISQVLIDRNLKNLKETESLEPLQRLYAAYDPNQAIYLHRIEIDRAKETLPPNQLAKKYIQFADLYASFSDPMYREANELYNEAYYLLLPLISKANDIENVIQLQYINEYFGDRLRNDWGEISLTYYNQVDTFRCNTFGNHSPVLTKNLKKIADVSLIEEDTLTAKNIYNEIITIWRPLVGPLEKKRRNTSITTNWWNTAWATSEKIASKWYWLDPNSYISSLESLGDLYAPQKNRTEALLLYKKAIDVLEWFRDPQVRITHPASGTPVSPFDVYASTYYDPITRKLTSVYEQTLARIKEKHDRLSAR